MKKPEPLFSKKLKKTVPLLILMDEEVSTKTINKCKTKYLNNNGNR